MIVHYDRSFMEYVAGVTGNTPAVHDFVCTTLRDNCTSVWDYNGLTTMDECLETLTALPYCTGDICYIDGNSCAAAASTRSRPHRRPSPQS